MGIFSRSRLAYTERQQTDKIENKKERKEEKKKKKEVKKEEEPNCYIRAVKILDPS